MAHQDQGRKSVQPVNAEDLQRALKWLVTGISFASIALRRDCTWTPQALTFAAFFWSWSDEKTLTERFTISRKIIRFLLGKQHEPAGSYQAFIKLLRRWTAPLRNLLVAEFRKRMREGLAAVWKVKGWVVFAVDGSRVDVPRTAQNEERYAPRSKLARAARKQRRKGKGKAKGHRRRGKKEARQRKANIPQIWLTVLWHVGSGLPWDYRTGPSDSSERGHLLEMLSSLPPRSLLTADAGFVGYEFCQKVLGGGHDLLLRVGGNIRLLKKLGYAREKEGLVYLWPNHAAKKRLPPLVLRLVIVSDGRHGVFLLTNVLEGKRLPDADAAAIYRRRWGIEVYYRHCKQTFERRKLRSHNPDNAMVELDWSLLGMWAMGLHSHVRLVRKGVRPQRISFANVWRAYRRPMREYRSVPDPGERLTELLDRALIDPYQRKNKASRDYARKKREPGAGPPQIIQATLSQVRLATQVKAEQKKRLTA
jgi:hypothetical protein